ncbi:MAG TPA: pentapeptide repeat-containing protein [Jiangellaceae bacterium]
MSIWSAETWTAELITAYVAIATAVGTAVWAVTRFLAERRDARAQAAALAAEQLKQRRDEELRSRQQRAADLVKAVGEATDPVARRWTMSALSLYPDESLDLLLNALGEANPEDAAAIKLAVTSVGGEALSRVVRAHRIALQICGTEVVPIESTDPVVGQRRVDVDNASRVRDCTREIIINLLFQLDDDQRAIVDLADVDFTGANLSFARFARTKFRKTRLDKADFTRARLSEAVFRGAKMDGTVLTRADLRSADLTGASGAVRAIRSDLTESILDQANFSHATMDAIRLKRASLRQAKLDNATLAGASLTGAVLDRTRLCRVSAHHVSASQVHGMGVDLSHADISDGKIPRSRFERTRLVRIEGTRLQADDSVFVNCNFGGAKLSQSSFIGVEFTGCVMGGVTLMGAMLHKARFRSCSFSSCDLSMASVTYARFDSCTFSGKVRLIGVDLTDVVFDRCIFRDNLSLITDNDSWQRASLDDVAVAAFRRSAPV